MMTPLEKLTDLDTEQSLQIVDEHGNSYTGNFYWDSEEKTHKLDEYKLVADYDSNTLYLVKPIQDDTISGFLVEVKQVKINSEE